MRFQSFLYQPETCNRCVYSVQLNYLPNKGDEYTRILPVEQLPVPVHLRVGFILSPQKTVSVELSTVPPVDMYVEHEV
jgi:hypothetical protein